MNNKIISILLIIGLLAVSMGGVYANQTVGETNLSNYNQEQVVMDDNINNNSADYIIDNSETNVSNQTINNTSEDTQYDKVEEEVYGLHSYMSFLEEMYTFTQEDYVTLIQSLEKYNNQLYAEIITLIKENDDDMLHQLYHKINSLPLEDKTMILNLIDDIYNENMQDDVDADTQQVMQKKTVKDFHQQKITNYNSNKQQKGNQKINRTYFKLNEKSVVPYKIINNINYERVLELIEQYKAGMISFDDFIEELEKIGIDTSNIILNDDGTITWDGKTIPAPNVEDDAYLVDDYQDSSQTISDENTSITNQHDTNTTSTM